MRITHFWSDEDTVMAARFDDGWIIAGTEKAAATIDTEGKITGTWWKEEPTDEHWGHYVAQCGSEITQHPLPIGDAMDDLIYKVGHHSGETATAAALALKAMIDWLVS